jgi:type I restriction enzyme S subunit
MIDGILIPDNWRWAEFREVADIASDLVDPKLTPSAVHIAPNHIESWTGRLLPFATVAADGVKSAKHRFSSGQILYSKIRPYLAKAAMATFDGVCSADMYPIEARIDAGFLLHWILTPWFTRETARNQGRTILPKINQDALNKLFVPVAALKEQRRIVAKIEELFSNLDAGVAALERARTNLKRYRASVLKAAVEGALTAEWRSKNPDTEPASKLLARILLERRRKWEADQLAKFKAAGKQPPQNWQAKYVEPTPPETTDLPELPEGWCWATWGQVSNWVTYGFTRPMPHVDCGYAIVTAKNVINGKIDFDDTHKTPRLSFDELSEKDRPREGDLLITKDGTIGRAAVVPRGMKFCINQSVAVVWLRSCPIDKAYLLTVIESDLTQKPIWAKARGSAIQHLSITDFARMAFPIPPENEQSFIANEVAEALSQIDTAETTISQVLLRAARLRQSILKQAFEGKLVPQDPTDEPAGVLLDRIKAGSQKRSDSNEPAKTMPRRKAKQKAT